MHARTHAHTHTHTHTLDDIIGEHKIRGWVYPSYRHVTDLSVVDLRPFPGAGKLPTKTLVARNNIHTLTYRLIRVHVMRGLVHPNYGSVTDLFVHDLLSSTGYPTCIWSSTDLLSMTLFHQQAWSSMWMINRLNHLCEWSYVGIWPVNEKGHGQTNKLHDFNWDALDHASCAP